MHARKHTQAYRKVKACKQTVNMTSAKHFYDETDRRIYFSKVHNDNKQNKKTYKTV